MAFADALAKLSAEDKKDILIDVAILPTIEDDKLLDKTEHGNILRAGEKLGFSVEEIEAAIEEQLRLVGATTEG